MESVKLLTSQLLDTCSQRQPTSVNSLWEEHLEIRKTLQEITHHQAPNPNDTAINRSDAIPDFFQWCDKVGLKRVDGIEIKAIEGRGFGLITSKSTNFGEKLITVPVKSMMTLEWARKSELKRALSSDIILQKMENVALAILLANEKMKGSESFWQFYIRLLPRSYSTPLYFETNELQLLKGSQYFEESLKLWRNIARQYAYFYQLMANDNSIFRETRLNLHTFTFELYKWATAAVMTRINFIPKDKTNTTPVLIPFWDMANHDATLQMCTDFDDENEIGLLYSGKSYEPGSEICIFYGARSNGEFFLHNGFVVDDDANVERDTVVVHLGLTKNDPLFSVKENALKISNLNASESFVLNISDDEQMLKKLQIFAQIFNADERQLQEMVFDQATMEKAQKFLKTRLELLTRIYTINSTNCASENAQLISKLVAKEKNILQHVIKRFDNNLN